jgi:hypothetical protein
MEKRYFVLKKGYLNIDEKFFYFTDHGNWETCEILEETENPKLTFQYIATYLFEILMTVIVITIFMFLLFGTFEFAFGIVFFMILIFQFFHQRYKISQFKIPIHKLERLQLASDKLTVRFANVKNEQIAHHVKLNDEAESIDLKKYLSEHFNDIYSNV